MIEQLTIENKRLHMRRSMVKLLYSISSVLLIFAIFLFAVCGLRLLQDAANSKGYLSGNHPDELAGNNQNSGLSILDQFEMIGTAEFGSMDNVSPLVEKAMEFALYLNPPKPPEPVIAQQPTIVPQPNYRPSTTARFRLLSTSYYLSSPEKSWALVSEPGKGDHWVAKGERVENFIVQSIEKGAIVYHDGNQTHKMDITVKEPAQLAQVRTQDKISITDTQTKIENEPLEILTSPLPAQDIGPG